MLTSNFWLVYTDVTLPPDKLYLSKKLGKIQAIVKSTRFGEKRALIEARDFSSDTAKKGYIKALAFLPTANVSVTVRFPSQFWELND